MSVDHDDSGTGVVAALWGSVLQLLRPTRVAVVQHSDRSRSHLGFDELLNGGSHRLHFVLLKGKSSYHAVSPLQVQVKLSQTVCHSEFPVLFQVILQLMRYFEELFACFVLELVCVQLHFPPFPEHTVPVTLLPQLRNRLPVSLLLLR